MTTKKTTRLDAPPVSLRELDRGRLTKSVSVEPHINPVREPLVMTEAKRAAARKKAK
ncbi:hypothetical protein [Geothrix oryzisoli]|uniref:hypothetical protein n=1 Tax=Geothrix oryzisoli TaxID=2922721 RepID=UPI001FAD5D9D|nr:hypothetical protein [Geothrix oryzisoli]